jgi:hypothetical protein
MVLLGTMYPLGLLVQGALADGIGLRATTAGTAVVLAVALTTIRVTKPGFDADLGDIAPRSDTAVIAAAE